MKTLLREIWNGKEKLTLWLVPLATFLILSVASPMLQAQTFTKEPRTSEVDASHLYRPYDLDGIWRVKAADNASDELAFAQTSFDDSRWTLLNLNDSLHSLFPSSHPRVIWYRQRIKVDPSQTGLALREQTLARAFEIYVNGERLMMSGNVAPFAPYSYDARLVASIPNRMIATGSLVVAVRVGSSDQDWRNPFPGLSAGNLTLGQEDALRHDDWLADIGESMAALLDVSLLIGVGFVALMLFAAQRHQYEYLWIFGLGMMRLAELPLQVIPVFENIPLGWIFLRSSFTIASPLLWVGMYFAFVNIKIGWKFLCFLGVAGVLNAYSQLGNQGLVPNLPGSYQLLTNLPFVVLLAIVIPTVLAIHWRRGNREAGILLIPAILFSLYIYANYALALLFQFPGWNHFATQGLNLIQRFPAGPFSISLDNVSGIASTLSLAIIMILRATRTSRQQALLESELEAAREVQQVILPEQMDTIPGFSIESSYAPAQQVGGDFFQIVPTGDGGLLLILGDVAGKGLPAAMLVSVLVGATRTVVAYTEAPDEILAQLNERLIGRSRGGFSTALAAHVSFDGLVTIANAGHLSPYLDGGELALPGALPLGIVSGATYVTTQFHLATGSRLTFYSDGVIEAQNASGELFGFARGQEVSTQPATKIVETAKQFGQSDDITVVAITRNSAIAIAA